MKRPSDFSRVTAAAFCVMAMVIAGCATPAGQIPDEDYAWDTRQLTIGYQAAYRNLRDGFRTCPGMIADGDLYTDIKEGRIVAYLQQGWPMQGRTDFVAGVMTLAGKDQESTILKIGVQKIYDRPVFGPPGQIRRMWAQWATGDLKCSSSDDAAKEKDTRG